MLAFGACVSRARPATVGDESNTHTGYGALSPDRTLRRPAGGGAWEAPIFGDLGRLSPFRSRAVHWAQICS